MGHRGSRQPLRPHPGQRRLQLQRRSDRDRGRIGKLQCVRSQLRSARPGRAERFGVRGATGDGHRRRRILVQGTEQLRQKQCRRELSEPDHRGCLWLRLSVSLSGQHRRPELQGGRHDGRRSGDGGKRQQPADPPVREQRSLWRDAGRIHALVGQLAGPAAVLERPGERDQGSEDLEHLQQDRLHVSVTEE